MHLDADAELEEIEPELRTDSQVLALRRRIYQALKKWDLMLVVAKELAQRDPHNVQWSISWAYATRRAISLDAARLVLLEAVERMPGEATLHYNLACYECQLGDLEVAKARLKHAITLEPASRAMALDDADLAPLWGDVLDPI
jgi:Flp pilus assembly protein TadD